MRKVEELLNSLDVIVWEWDVQTERFTFVSQGAERILGFPLHHWEKGSEFWVSHLYP